jgi:hypothetical protein
MKIFIKNLVVLIACWLFSSLSTNIYAQTVVNLSSAGSLKDVADIDTVNHLIITGNIDVRDITFEHSSVLNTGLVDKINLLSIGLKVRIGFKL